MLFWTLDDDVNDPVVQFYPWFKFYFPLILVMVKYDNEFETKENKIQTKKKNCTTTYNFSYYLDHCPVVCITQVTLF